jgi:hypothetical protein
MTPGDPVRAAIVRIKTLTDIITIVGTRIYRHSLPPDPVFPAITVRQISDIGDAGTHNDDAAHMRIRCTGWASTDPAAATLSQLLKKQVPCKNTALSDGTIYIRVSSIEDAGETPDQNTDVPAYMYHRDFMIVYDY